MVFKYGCNTTLPTLLRTRAPYLKDSTFVSVLVLPTYRLRMQIRMVNHCWTGEQGSHRRVALGLPVWARNIGIKND